jgi:hypothetical protein
MFISRYKVAIPIIEMKILLGIFFPGFLISPPR